MLETKVKLVEDRPDRIVVSESLRPWQWGGFDFSFVQIFLLLLFPFILVVKGAKRVVFDTAYQNVTVDSRILFFHRRKQVQFSDIENIVLSPHRVTRAVGGTGPGRHTAGDMSMAVSLNLGDLSLILSDKSDLKIGIAYWSDKEIREVGDRVSGLLGKPFVEESGSVNR